MRLPVNVLRSLLSVISWSVFNFSIDHGRVLNKTGAFRSCACFVSSSRQRQDKTTLFNQGSPISCKAGILSGPGFNKTYIYTFTIKLQGKVKFAKITGGKKRKKSQIKCPLRRRLKIARELASLILVGSELKAKRPEFLKVRLPSTRFVLFGWIFLLCLVL